jgi:hypothetical protein
MRTFVQVALALLLLAPAARAQGAPPWERQEARAEGRRVLEEILKVMQSSERGDPKPAAAALTDASWLVRHLAAIRLEVLGLDEGTARTLRDRAGPDQPAPEASWEPLKKAREFAAALTVDLGPETKIPLREALRIAASILTERVKAGPEEPLGKRRLIESALAWRASVEEEADRAWLARRLLGLTDIDQALDDLGSRTADKAVGKDGKDVYEWYAANAGYLYWHPKERRFRVDVEARTAKQPTTDFRKQTPWPADQGPNAPAKETDASR